MSPMEPRTLRQKLLRWIFPKDERARASLRELRSYTEANADDLTRTLNMDSGRIESMMKAYRAREAGRL